MDAPDWFMRGEVDATRRPKNSALELDLDFDTTVKPPPQVGRGSQLGEAAGASRVLVCIPSPAAPSAALLCPRVGYPNVDEPVHFHTAPRSPPRR
jgi:hypothetical protein